MSLYHICKDEMVTSFFVIYLSSENCHYSSINNTQQLVTGPPTVKHREFERTHFCMYVDVKPSLILQKHPDLELV